MKIKYLIILYVSFNFFSAYSFPENFLDLFLRAGKIKQESDIILLLSPIIDHYRRLFMKHLLICNKYPQEEKIFKILCIYLDILDIGLNIKFHNIIIEALDVLKEYEELNKRIR